MKRIIIVWTLSLFIGSARCQNYDESKVPPYTLPNALKTLNNTPVTDNTQWETIRRPEIVTLFENNIYGQMPKSYDSIKFSIKNDNPLAMAGRAHLKEVVIEVFRINKSVKINLVLFTPNKVTCPAATFLLINISGKNAIDPARIIKSDIWPAEMLIDSGYAIAAFDKNDAAPDTNATYKNGALQLYPEQLAQNNGMKAVGAWGWAASRVLDYFEKDPAIDAKKVALVGHSRGGKAALWAAAKDQRFAIVFSNCSGNTGAALARRRFGQTIRDINTKFPYWFNNNYKKFNDKEDSLPVDQHMLMSLIAPRPVYATSASLDLWADPKGSFLSLKNAENVYALYKLTSNLPSALPSVNTPTINSPMGYHLRDGAHALTAYDWGNFIKFANYNHLKNRSNDCASAQTILPQADAFVRDGAYAGNNYNSDTSLIVKGSSTINYSRSSYLKFSLSGISNVVSAKLRIYGSNKDNTTGINLSVFGVSSDAWTENGITFSSAPAASISALSSVIVNNTAKYYELDVTGFVKQQLSGDKIVSFLIKNTTNQDKTLSFKSKECRLNKPQLVITTSGLTPTSARSNKTASSSADNLEKPKIFPNPTCKKFNIRFPPEYKGDILLQIVSQDGKIYDLGPGKLRPGGSQVEIDISRLSLTAGIYFLKVYNNTRNDIIKLIIQ